VPVELGIMDGCPCEVESSTGLQEGQYPHDPLGIALELVRTKFHVDVACVEERAAFFAISVIVGRKRRF
jgi:hypothetical protein